MENKSKLIEIKINVQKEIEIYCISTLKLKLEKNNEGSIEFSAEKIYGTFDEILNSKYELVPLSNYCVEEYNDILPATKEVHDLYKKLISEINKLNVENTGLQN